MNTGQHIYTKYAFHCKTFWVGFGRSVSGDCDGCVSKGLEVVGLGLLVGDLVVIMISSRSIGAKSLSVNIKFGRQRGRVPR